MDKLTKLLQENRLDLKTMIVLNKAIRTIRHFENQAAKQHNLTPTQFSVLETLYSKGNLRIQDLIDKMLATSGNMTVVIKI
ncbi:transcriptional regulator, MarR family [Streptococcus constellatus subsp. pharyngis SK1060 = CCUG 46377]|uniref:Transcriptional regulator, MarR family n=1 Tax=Streptococcus constellatus subsp. pharyngis SK1060 = CCUG 46377 TaxID=1035184 RepID=F9P6D0_STRCV|nr:transcriptional regulator, MarR family [Streptococcus constellatus subsp. pharyngis SK1060 = CCUG 46377]